MTLPRPALLIAGLTLLIAAFAGMTATSQARGNHHRTRADRNGDRLPDRWERSHHLSLRVNQASHDQDSDGMRNRAEFLSGTDPRDSDSDDDGVGDGAENAGRVVSFTDGVLTIEPFGGGEAVKARVDASTEIGCEHRAAAPTTTASAAGSDDEDRADGEHASGRETESGDREGDDGDREDGDRHHGHGDGDHHGSGGDCTATVADLKPGAVLQEADLKVLATGAVWHELELVLPV